MSLDILLCGRDVDRGTELSAQALNDVVQLLEVSASLLSCMQGESLHNLTPLEHSARESSYAVSDGLDIICEALAPSILQSFGDVNRSVGGLFWVTVRLRPVASWIYWHIPYLFVLFYRPW